MTKITKLVPIFESETKLKGTAISENSLSKNNTTAWLAVNKLGVESVYLSKPERASTGDWTCYVKVNPFPTNINWRIELTEGSIKKLIGKTLTWDDEPVELT
jgi:hypothetical protein